MRVETAGYRNRFQTALRNVQASRGIRPADVINGFRMVQPLRSLHAPGASFDMAHLAMELFTRLHITYSPCVVPPRRFSVSAMPARGRGGRLRVGLFVDAPDHLSGVAMTLREWQEQAARAGEDLFVHSCGQEIREGHAVTFPPMGVLSLGMYEGLSLPIPRIDDVMAYVQRMPFDAIHVSTPGPMGLLGLLAARQRGIPVCGTYHTDFPRYAGELTGDPAAVALGWRFMRWFYGQLDRVAAPTESVKRELAANGLDAARLRVVGRGVDTARFHPGYRDAAWRAQHGQGRSLVLLYVGRLSREKNLQVLAEAFQRLMPTRPDVALVLVGDGPFRGELERMLHGTPATFTGVLAGEALARAYASSDLFVFPSKTDTFRAGRARGAGIGPCRLIVSDEGGPKDAMHRWPAPEWWCAVSTRSIAGPRDG
jgi:glycosyltransferase involved in cell wall biosynthesis